VTATYSQSPGAGIARAPSYGWSLLESVVLFLMMAVPPYWLGFSNLYALVPVAVTAAYVIGTPATAFLRQPANAASKLRFAVFAVAQLVSGCAVAAGLSILLATTWIHFAYRAEMVSPDGMGLGGPFELTTAAPLALGLIAVAVAALVASAALLRRDGESVGGWFARVHKDGSAILWLAAATCLVLGFAVLSMANIVASAISLPALLMAADPSRIVDVWRVAGEFPGFPLAVLAAATLLAAYRHVQRPAIESLCGKSAGTPIGLPAMSAILASIAGGYAWFLYMLHVGVVAALGTVAMIVSWGEVSRATDAWIEAQQAAGREPSEIAAELRSHGSWTVDGPAPGRPRSVPRLGGTLSELGLSSECSVTVDAGVADNSALRNQGWIAGYVAGFRPLPEVSYCIRLACPSPAVWQERPVVILHSSHPSRNPAWAYNLFMDVFGAGAAPNAGGYCTAGGRLAASYQG